MSKDDKPITLSLMESIQQIQNPAPEILNEGASGFVLADYETKFAEDVLKNVVRSLDKKRFDKTNVKVARRGSRSMAVLDFSGYTRSDTAFSGDMYILFDVNGKNMVSLSLKGVQGPSQNETVVTFGNTDPVDPKKIASYMNEKVEHSF